MLPTFKNLFECFCFLFLGLTRGAFLLFPEFGCAGELEAPLAALGAPAIGPLALWPLQYDQLNAGRVRRGRRRRCCARRRAERRVQRGEGPVEAQRENGRVQVSIINHLTCQPLQRVAISYLLLEPPQNMNSLFGKSCK